MLPTLPPMGPGPSGGPAPPASAALDNMEGKANAKLEGLEDSIEALIEAQRALPLPSASAAAAGDRVVRQPMRLKPGTTLGPAAPGQVSINRGSD